MHVYFSYILIILSQYNFQEKIDDYSIIKLPNHYFDLFKILNSYSNRNKLQSCVWIHKIIYLYLPITYLKCLPIKAALIRLPLSFSGTGATGTSSLSRTTSGSCSFDKMLMLCNTAQATMIFGTLSILFCNFLLKQANLRLITPFRRSMVFLVRIWARLQSCSARLCGFQHRCIHIICLGVSTIAQKKALDITFFESHATSAISKYARVMDRSRPASYYIIDLQARPTN